MTTMLDQACEAIERLPERKHAAPGPFTLADLESEPPYFEITDGAVIVYWGGYDYDSSLSLLSTPLTFLGFILQITEKSWPLTTPGRINDLIDAVCAEKGWNPHTGEMAEPAP